MFVTDSLLHVGSSVSIEEGTMSSGELQLSPVFSKLCSAMKLERDRGQEELRALLPSLAGAETEQLLAEASAVLDQPEVVWHYQLGGITCIRCGGHFLLLLLLGNTAGRRASLGFG